MIRTILIDDEAPARDELRYLLTTNHSTTIDIIGEADNATSAISLITREKPQLIFLDIHMRGLSGLELAEVIRDISPDSRIIFATAYDEYALKAFELQALDYVVKPIEEERLAKAIQHVLKALYPKVYQQLNPLHSILIQLKAMQLKQFHTKQIQRKPFHAQQIQRKQPLRLLSACLRSALIS